MERFFFFWLPLMDITGAALYVAFVLGRERRAVDDRLYAVERGLRLSEDAYVESQYRCGIKAGMTDEAARECAERARAAYRGQR